MFIKDLVMWRHYNVILEKSDITTRSWQRLGISNNLNLLSAYVIWNILVLNIKGKVNKIVIKLIIIADYNCTISLCHSSNHNKRHVTMKIVPNNGQFIFKL
jgi:hypothetical protein